jgi:DNA-3-methyladenine glycosylase I
MLKQHLRGSKLVTNRNPSTGRIRCPWTGSKKIYVSYHDNEWGIPQHDDQKLFEMLLLEGAQAGLNWITILNKRENYRQRFDGFDPHKIARYSDARIAQLLQDPGIVRNRLKIRSTRTNARAFLTVQEEFETFNDYIWQFVEGAPRQNAWKSMSQVPASTDESKIMSRDLKRRGFTFVGSTICYAFMQATGMVNDHLVSCFRYRTMVR